MKHTFFKPETIKVQVPDNLITEQQAHKLAVEEAAKSTARKRKVGAVILDGLGKVCGAGFNHNMHDASSPCEDEFGETLDCVIHAEAAAIMDMNLREGSPVYPLTMYVTHEPCPGCTAAIRAANIANIKIVGEFLKFDTSKTRYDLVPPSAIKAIANVLTYGAKKYKPNNWQLVEDTERYTAALYRHLEAWRSGEINDSESGLPHLEHAMTNLAFLIELGAKPAWSARKRK